MPNRNPWNYSEVEPGAIFAGVIPYYPRELAELHERGVRAILSLTRRDFTTYPDMGYGTFQMDYIHVPIVDSGLPSEGALNTALDFMNWAYSHQKPIYVHCRGGMGRTGIILMAFYIVRRGLSLNEAKSIVNRRQWNNLHAANWGSPQHEWVLNLENYRA